MEVKYYNEIWPLLIDQNELICLSGNSIIVYGEKEEVILNKFYSGINLLVSKSSLLQRILRNEISDLVKVGNEYIGVHRNGIFTINKSGDLKFSFSEFEGSRPLNLCVDIDHGKMYFGEYFSNSERGIVKIFESINGQNWDVVFTFPEKSIRHVHACIYDEARKGTWVLTGDSNEESGIWFTDDGFKNLKKVFGGSQSARAVSIIPTLKGLIIPMDTPQEQNYIQYLNLDPLNVQNLFPIAGSAFHALKINDLYLVTTVTEPSDVNDLNNCFLYASLNGKDWKEISSHSRDVFPVDKQKYTRYSELKLLKGLWKGEFIVAQGRALQGLSLGMVTWNYLEVVNFCSK